MIRLSGCSALAMAVGIVAGLSACQATVDQRGNLPTPDSIAQIKPGKTDRANVTRILGSPSSVASFDNNTWYYISQKTKEVAFFKPEVIDQEIVVVTFDKEGVVSDVQKLGMKGRRDIQPVARTTPAPGKELSFIEQLIGNFGRFSTNNKSPQ